MTIMTYSPTHDQMCAIAYERIQRARSLHPEKLSLNGRVATVISECCEVLDAIEKGDLNHAMYEYFDVLATAFRGHRRIAGSGGGEDSMSAVPEMCPPDEIYDGRLDSPRFSTVTIEKAELAHLMAIASSVYGYLELGQPDTAIRDAYAHYSAFCSSSTKVLQRMARDKAASDKALKSLFDTLYALDKHATQSNKDRVVRAYKNAAKFFVK